MWSNDLARGCLLWMRCQKKQKLQVTISPILEKKVSHLPVFSLLSSFHASNEHIISVQLMHRTTKTSQSQFLCCYVHWTGTTLLLYQKNIVRLALSLYSKKLRKIKQKSTPPSPLLLFHILRFHFPPPFYFFESRIYCQTLFQFICMLLKKFVEKCDIIKHNAIFIWFSS